MEPREPCCALNIVSGCHGEGKEPGPTEADGQMDRQGVPGALDSTQRGMCRMQESDQGISGRPFRSHTARGTAPASRGVLGASPATSEEWESVNLAGLMRGPQGLVLLHVQKGSQLRHGSRPWGAPKEWGRPSEEVRGDHRCPPLSCLP